MHDFSYPRVEVTPQTMERIIQVLEYVRSQASIEPPGVSRCKDESLIRDCDELLTRLNNIKLYWRRHGQT